LRNRRSLTAPARIAADLGGQYGSRGVVTGDTDLGDLCGHPSSGMGRACGHQVVPRLGGQSGHSDRLRDAAS
jgi:hypothetical protein